MGEWMRILTHGIIGVAIGGVLMYAALENAAPVTVSHRTSTEDLEAQFADTLLAQIQLQPVSIQIPAIGLAADFEEPLGVSASGEMEVPEAYNTVGWYRYSPAPGMFGPSVVLGHVDSYKGPAVFYSLGKLKNGDEIAITRSDGSVALFSVTGSERYPKNAFPTEKVYGNIDHAGLRLITCAGTYDRTVERYDKNLVVYAVRIEDPNGL